MKGHKDYTGQKFGQLTILSQFKKEKKWYCRCRCDCGQKKTSALYSVVYGNIKTCGGYKCKRKQFFGFTQEYIGKKINHLTILSEINEGYRNYFYCRCDCGREKKMRTYDIIKGNITSCGVGDCRKKLGYPCVNRRDLTGKRFGRLKVIKLSHIKDQISPAGNNASKVYWLCKCDCGKMHETITQALLSGACKSCGCYWEDQLFPFFVEDSYVLCVLTKLGYKKDGRKIGVSFKPQYSKFGKWYAAYTFQSIKRYYWFDTYEDALEKRLKIQEKVFIPFVFRHKSLLPKNFDITPYKKINSNIKFDPIKYEKNKKREYLKRKNKLTFHSKL